MIRREPAANGSRHHEGLRREVAGVKLSECKRRLAGPPKRRFGTEEMMALAGVLRRHYVAS